MTVRGDLSALGGDLQHAKSQTEAVLATVTGGGGGMREALGARVAAKHVQEGVKDITAEFARLKVQAASTSNDIQRAFEESRRGAMGALAMLAAESAALYAVGRSLLYVLQRGSAVTDVFETMHAEMSQMQSEAFADDMLKRFKQFSTEVGISVPSLYEMSRAFIQAKYSSKQVVDTLRLLGDASGGTEKRFHMLSRVYQQMQNGGIQFSRAFRMLSREGIITVQDLAKHYGITEHAAKEMVQKNTIDFVEFTKILKGITGEGGRMHGALDRMASTGVRLSAALRSAVDIAYEWLYAPLDPYLDALTVTITQMTNQLSQFLEWGGKTLSFAVAGAAVFSLLAAAVGAAVVALGGLSAIVAFGAASMIAFWPIVLEVAGAIATTVAVIVALGAAMGALASILHIPEAIAAGWNYMVSVIQRSGIVDFVYTLMDIWDAFYQTLTLIVDGIIQLLAPWATAFGKWADSSLMSIIRFVVSGHQYIADFVLNSLEWTNAILINWQSVWAKLPDIIRLAMMGVDHAFSIGLSVMTDTLMSIFAEMLHLTYQFAAEMVIALMGVTKGVDAKTKNSIKNMAATAANATIKATGLDKTTGASLMDMFKPNEEMKNFSKQSGLENLFQQIFGTKKELEGKRRRNRGKGAALDEGGPPTPERDTNERSGIFSIQDYGRTLQQMLLDPKTDRVVNAIETGNEIQKELVSQMMELNRKPFGLA